MNGVIAVSGHWASLLHWAIAAQSYRSFVIWSCVRWRVF